MSNDRNYAEGLYGKERDGQPDFVVGSLSLDKKRFMAWLEEQEGDAKGYIRLNVLRQKADPQKWSVSLDDWTPTEKTETTPAPAPAPAQTGAVDDSEMPF